MHCRRPAVCGLAVGAAARRGVAKNVETNTTIPAGRTETFSTAADDQTAVDVVVLLASVRWRTTTASSRPLASRAGAARDAADRGDV
jgi:molecular chaperone DnaK